MQITGFPCCFGILAGLISCSETQPAAFAQELLMSLNSVGTGHGTVAIFTEGRDFEEVFEFFCVVRILKMCNLGTK